MALKDCARLLTLAKRPGRRHQVEIEIADRGRARGGAADRAGDRAGHDAGDDQRYGEQSEGKERGPVQ